MTSLDHSVPEFGDRVGSARSHQGKTGEPSSDSPVRSTQRAAIEAEAGVVSGGQSALRILLVTEPGVDGVFRHVEALAHFLLAHGHQVDLAYSSVRGSDALGELVAKVIASGGLTLDLAVSNGPGPGDLPALFRLRQLVSAARPDVIHGHSSKAGALVRALRAMGVRQPLFYTPHAYYGLCAPAGLKAKIFGGIERLLGGTGTTFNLSGCEKAYAEETLRVPARRLRLIPNPVDSQRFAPVPPEEKRSLRRSLGLPDDALLLGCVGRLAYQKDPITLYRSFAAASGRMSSLWLYHLGTGELATECARLAGELGIESRIIRRDYLGDPLPFYQAIDAAILTSRYEGLSLAALEALACDLPLILSEAPGNLDFLKINLSHCWSAPPENPERMAEAIVQWGADQPRHRPSNHRATAVSRFSQEICFGAVVAEYHKQARR